MIDDPKKNPLSRKYAEGLYGKLDFNNLDFEFRVSLGLYAEIIFPREEVFQILDNLKGGGKGKLDRILVYPLNKVLSLDSQRPSGVDGKSVLYMSIKRIDPKAFRERENRGEKTKEYIEKIKESILPGQASSL